MAITADTVIVFDGADQTPWSDARFAETNAGTTDLINSALQQNTTSTENLITYTDSSASADQASKAEIGFGVDKDDIDELKLVLLNDQSGNRYECRFVTSELVELWKITAGSGAKVGTFTSTLDTDVALAPNDVLACAVDFPDSDAVFTLLYNGTATGSTVTDSSSPHTSGQPGFETGRGGGSRRIRVFEVGYDGTAAASPTISSGTATVKPGDTYTLSGSNLDLVTTTTFAGVAVTPTTQNASTIEFTVPDAYANGLAFQTQTVQVTDGSNPDSTTTTLNPPTAVTFSGTVAGYPPAAGQKDFFDDPTITAVDGDGYIVEDPSGIIVVMNDDGTAEFSTTGSVTVRLHDVSDTADSSQGTWTDERTVNITEADLANSRAVRVLSRVLKRSMKQSMRFTL